MRTPAKTLSAIFTIAVMLRAILCQAETSQPMRATQWVRAQQIPIFGVIPVADREVGSVAHLLVTVAERADSSGLAVLFPRSRGRLSPMAETSIQQGIYRTARVAGLSTDSLSVMVSVLDPDMPIHGLSLSSMVSITVLALARKAIQLFPRE